MKIDANPWALKKEQFPTVPELAKLAAILATKEHVNPIDGIPKALDLWAGCQNAIDQLKAFQAKQERQSEEKWTPILEIIKPWPTEEDGSPKEKITLPKFLELCIPLTKSDDRLAKYRRYLAESVRESRWLDSVYLPSPEVGGMRELMKDPPPIDAIPLPEMTEVASWIEKRRREGISRITYQIEASNIAEWFLEHSATQKAKRSEKASEARSKQAASKRSKPKP